MVGSLQLHSFVESSMSSIPGSIQTDSILSLARLDSYGHLQEQVTAISGASILQISSGKTIPSKWGVPYRQKTAKEPDRSCIPVFLKNTIGLDFGQQAIRSRSKSSSSQRRQRGPLHRGGEGKSGYAGFPLWMVSLHLVNEGRISAVKVYLCCRRSVEQERQKKKEGCYILLLLLRYFQLDENSAPKGLLNCLFYMFTRHCWQLPLPVPYSSPSHGYAPHFMAGYRGSRERADFMICLSIWNQIPKFRPLTIQREAPTSSFLYVELYSKVSQHR